MAGECVAPPSGDTLRTIRQLFNSPGISSGAYAPMSDGTLLAFLLFLCGAIAGAFVTYLFALSKVAPPSTRDCPTGEMRVSALYLYPIKSCAGYAVESADITPRGFRHDRTYMVVDDDYRFVSQRKIPAMALVRPKFIDDTTLIVAAGEKTFQHTPVTSGECVDVVVWSSTCQALDQGDEVAEFLSEFLDTPGLRLVRMADDCVREVELGYLPPHVYETSFSDGYPYLLVSESSRVEVSRQVGREISMARFRPNIVVDGDEVKPFDEDFWETARIGPQTVFQLPKISSRCKIPTVDPEKGTFDKDNEPTVTLRRIRAVGRKVLFGQNAVCARGQGASIQVGDDFKVVAMHSERRI